jgi:tetratricopeptide (TPR) repeat protein
MKLLTILALISIMIFYGCSDKRTQSQELLRVGTIHYRNNKFDSSLIYLNNAIRVYSLNSEAYYYLAKINYQIENYDVALKNLALAEENKFNSKSIDSLKLEILFAMENYDEYIRYCDKLISNNPSNYELYLNKAKALYNKSSDDATDVANVKLCKDALDNVNISLELNNSDNETYVLRGAIRYKLLDFKGAISDFEITLNKEKKDSSIISAAYRYKGMTEQEMNNLRYAEILLDSAILFGKNGRKISVLYINRGDIRVKLKKVELACEDYRKALEYGDNNFSVDRLRENCK